MDNPTRWNITNSAQNIVSALVDPSKLYDGAFRREWSNTFAGFSQQRPSTRLKHDAEIKTKLTEYSSKLNNRQHIKTYEAQAEAKLNETLPREGEVPEIFLREDFDLSKVETFAQVISVGLYRSKEDFLKTKKDDAKSPDVRTNIPTTTTTTTTTITTTAYDNDEHDQFYFGERIGKNHQAKLFTKSQLRELQQNFTDYLDTIEERLASQISNRSGDFFQVMSSVDSVMDELSLAIKSVTNLRRKCSKLKDTLILPNMRSIHINRTRNNAQAVLDKMNEISYLCKVQPMIQILLSASDFVGALDLIARSRAMLHKDLSRVIALRHLESQLVEIERMIGIMMQQEFLTLISSEWDGPLSQQSSAASRLSKLFDYFANGYSELPEKGSLSLLSLLQIQAEKFVNQFHEERKKRVESALDIEQWKVVEVPPDFQHLISMLIDRDISIGGIFSTENGYLSRDSSGVTLSNMDTAPAADMQSLEAHLNNQLKISADPKKQLDSEKKSRRARTLSHVEAGGTTYVIVNSVINLIRTVMDYCKCAHDIRSLSADLLERLFKTLSLYNTKTYLLVYSAGAIQVAGLKTITTRSLVVSQRSLKLIILMLPAIRRHFSKLLPDDIRLKRFDEIIDAYEEHAGRIPQRVQAIVKDVINLQLQEWEAKPPVPSAQFGAVSQHLARLHDNVQDALPDDELKLLFRMISQTFKEVLITHLRRLNITADAGPQQWLVMQELTFYKVSMSKLSAFNGFEFDYDDLWSSLGESSRLDPSQELGSGRTKKMQQNSGSSLNVAPFSSGQQDSGSR